MPETLRSPAARTPEARPFDRHAAPSAAATPRGNVGSRNPRASNDARITHHVDDARRDLDPDALRWNRLDSYALMREAQAARDRLLGDLVAAGARFVAASLTRACERYLRRRKTRAIYGALHELDDRTLRDLGFHRCEIWSVAAEATGEAEWTRVRPPLRPRAPG